MQIEKVYSPVNDRNIKDNLNSSVIWKDCYKEEEFEEYKKRHSKWFCYTIKFKGLLPIQVNKVQKIK